ncbi:MAG: acetate--CoA ligase family protein [Chloroflexota bacterium]
MPSSRDLAPLLRPRSVAIVGASSRAESLAGRPLANLQRQRFPGPIYPINPRREEIAGLRSYPSVGALPETPDLAIIIAPGQHALPALEACAERGVRAAIVISAGFGELDAAGAAQQRRMAELAAGSGMVLCGPNSIGCLNFVDFIPLSFTSSEDMDQRKTGRVAIASQSGGLMGSLANRAYDAGVGVSYGVATGNEADLTVIEALEWLAEEGSSDAFILIVEQIRDGARFMALGRRLLELGKPLVAYKIGRTETGGAAARSHTGALAGSYEALQAVFRQLGTIEAHDLDDLVDLAAAAARGRWPQGPNIGVITGSGGAGAAAADRAEELGMTTPPFAPDLADQLRTFLPGFTQAVENPFDATAQLIENPGTTAGVAKLLLDSPGIDAVLAVDPGTGVAGRMRAEALVPVAAAASKPLFQVTLSGSMSSGQVDSLRAAGVPVFRSPVKAVEALAGLRRFGLAKSTLSRRGGRGQGEATLDRAFAEVSAKPGEFQAKRFLAQLGIPVVDERLAHSADEAVSAAEELGYPVAVKVHSPDIIHKTEAGGVRLNVAGADGVRSAYAAMPASSVLVTRMLDVRLELITGFHTDPTFGPLVLLGLGGIWAETIRDVAMRPAPLAPEDVLDMVNELRGEPLLRGARGLPPVDLAALQRVLLAISDIAAAGAAWLQGLDVNPLALTADGRLVVLDASLFLK